MNTSFIKAVSYGWLAILCLFILSAFVMSLIIRFSSISEQSILYLSLATAFISLFISGLISGLKGKQAGWLLGICTGAGFSLFTFLLQFLAFDDLFTIKQVIFHLAYLMTCIIGSVIGVNVLRIQN